VLSRHLLNFHYCSPFIVISRRLIPYFFFLIFKEKGLSERAALKGLLDSICLLFSEQHASPANNHDVYAQIHHPDIAGQ